MLRLTDFCVFLMTPSIALASGELNSSTRAAVGASVSFTMKVTTASGSIPLSAPQDVFTACGLSGVTPSPAAAAPTAPVQNGSSISIVSSMLMSLFFI